MRVFLHLVQVYLSVRDGTYILLPQPHDRKPENNCTVARVRGVLRASCSSKMSLHLFHSSSVSIAGKRVTTNSLSSQRYPNGAAPPNGLPSFARMGTEAATRLAISSRSHCAIAAIMV